MGRVVRGFPHKPEPPHPGTRPPYPLPVEAGDRDSGLRLAELVGAFSLATDLGLGQPMEHVLRSWLIAAAWATTWASRRTAGPPCTTSSTLAWVGCVADTPDLAAWFGDDIAYRGDS